MTGGVAGVAASASGRATELRPASASSDSALFWKSPAAVCTVASRPRVALPEAEALPLLRSPGDTPPGDSRSEEILARRPSATAPWASGTAAAAGGDCKSTGTCGAAGGRAVEASIAGGAEATCLGAGAAGVRLSATVLRAALSAPAAKDGCSAPLKVWDVVLVAAVGSVATGAAPCPPSGPANCPVNRPLSVGAGTAAAPRRAAAAATRSATVGAARGANRASAVAARAAAPVSGARPADKRLYALLASAPAGAVPGAIAAGVRAPAASATPLEASAGACCEAATAWAIADAGCGGLWLEPCALPCASRDRTAPETESRSVIGAGAVPGAIAAGCASASARCCTPSSGRGASVPAATNAPAAALSALRSAAGKPGAGCPAAGAATKGSVSPGGNTLPCRSPASPRGTAAAGALGADDDGVRPVPREVPGEVPVRADAAPVGAAPRGLPKVARRTAGPAAVP
ncbi:MAG: hypothetical protein ACI87W_001283 [Halieaceae bacterium]|jgi:hypothetical protein